MDEIDVKSICRACKRKSDRMRSIFETKNCDGTDLKVADLIMACASVTIANEDVLPKSICESCLDRLFAAYSFKKQVESTDFSLRETFQIKQELNNTNDFGSTTDFKQSTIKQELEDDSKLILSYSCSICNKNFTSHSALVSHQQTHRAKKYSKSKSSKTFRCKLCHESFPRKMNVRRHMFIHLKDKPYVCKTCKRGFANSTNLSNHEMRCMGQRPFICTLCNRGFQREDTLRVHKGSHKGQAMLDTMDNIENYIEIDEPDNVDNEEISPQEFLDPNIAINEVDKEESTFNQYEDVKKYVKYEKKSDSSFTCDICSKTFIRSYHLSRHKKSHFDEKPFQCEICQKTFTRKDHMLRHLRLHSVPQDVTFPCDQCSSVFARKEVLVRHKANKHNEGERPTPEKRFQCEICSKCFAVEKYRDMHVKAHALKREDAICKTCNQNFVTRKELVRHLSLANDCSKKFLCSECGQRFIKQSQLLVHIRRHRGEKPFKCRYCDKGFPRTTDLKAHEKCHTGEKNHLCIVCGKGFGRACKLTLHMRTHTGEKPYACTMCNASFAQRNDLKTHIRRHTGERYHCDLCPEAFLVGYMLTNHKRKIHGIEIASPCPRILTQFPLRAPEEPKPLINNTASDEISESNTKETNLT